MTVQPHRVSRREGDGSGVEIDDKYDGEEYETKDQRADTRTTFYKSDIEQLSVSERRKKRLRRALRRNEGEDYGEGTSSDKTRRQRKQQNRQEGRRRDISAFSSFLELTKRQKNRVTHLLFDVVTINSFGNYSFEQVALGTINVIAREDGRWIEEEEAFHDLMIQVGIEKNGNPDMDRLQKLRAMVCERVPSLSAAE